MSSHVVFEVRCELIGDSLLFFSDYTFRYTHWDRDPEMPKDYYSMWKVEKGIVYFKHLDCVEPYWSSNTDKDFAEAARKADKIIKKVEKILLEE